MAHVTSQQLSQSFRDLADRIDKHTFTTDAFPTMLVWFGDDKESFRECVRAMGGGQKDMRSFDLQIQGQVGVLKINSYLHRDAICKRVTKMVETETWECEPLLSPEEEQQISEAK